MAADGPRWSMCPLHYEWILGLSGLWTLRSCLWRMLFLLFQELPDSLKEQTHLKEWHIHSTLIQIIPTYIELFQAMRILDLPKNQITCLPAEIGRFLGRNLWPLPMMSKWVLGRWHSANTPCPPPAAPGRLLAVSLSLALRDLHIWLIYSLGSVLHPNWKNADLRDEWYIVWDL